MHIAKKLTKKIDDIPGGVNSSVPLSVGCSSRLPYSQLWKRKYEILICKGEAAAQWSLFAYVFVVLGNSVVVVSEGDEDPLPVAVQTYVKRHTARNRVNKPRH